MAMLRNTFVTSLARFTNLHAPASMEPKSAKAFRALLFVADDVGNHLHVSESHQSSQANSLRPALTCKHAFEVAVRASSHAYRLASAWTHCSC